MGNCLNCKLLSERNKNFEVQVSKRKVWGRGWLYCILCKIEELPGGWHSTTQQEDPTKWASGKPKAHTQ